MQPCQSAQTSIPASHFAINLGVEEKFNDSAEDSLSTTSSSSDSNIPTLKKRVKNLEEAETNLRQKISILKKVAQDLKTQNAELQTKLAQVPSAAKRRKVESISNNNNHPIVQQETTKKIVTVERSVLIENNELYKRYSGLKNLFEKKDNEQKPIEQMFLFRVPTGNEELYYAIPYRLVQQHFPAMKNFANYSFADSVDLSFVLKKNEGDFYKPEAILYVLQSIINSDPTFKLGINFRPLSLYPDSNAIFEDVLMLGHLLGSEKLERECAEYVASAIKDDRDNIVELFDYVFSCPSIPLQKAWVDGVLAAKQEASRKATLKLLKNMMRNPVLASIQEPRMLLVLSCVLCFQKCNSDSCELVFKLSSVKSTYLDLDQFAKWKNEICSLIDKNKIPSSKDLFWPKLLLAKIHLTDKKSEEAKKILDELADQASPNDQWWISLLQAQHHFEENHVARALNILTSFKEQFGLKEKQPLVYIHALLYRGQIFRQQGHLEKALEDIQEVLKMDPENPEALLESAEIFQQKNKDHDISNHLKNVLNISKEQCDTKIAKDIFDLTWDNKARALQLMMPTTEKKENWDEFIQCIETLKTRFNRDIIAIPDSDNSLVVWALAQAAYLKKDYKTAIKKFDAIVSSRKKGLYGRALSRIAIHDFNNACQDFLRLKESHYWNPSIHLDYVRTLFNMSNNLEALKEVDLLLLQCIDEDLREKAIILRSRILTNLGQGNPLEDLDAILERNPENVEALRARGIYWLQHDQLEQAETDLLPLEKLAPENDKILTVLADFYLRGKKLDQVEKYSKKAIELNPYSNVGYEFLGSCFQEQKKFEDALANFIKAAEINPKPFNLKEICNIYSSLNDYENCIKYLLKLDKIQPNDMTTLKNLGYSYSMMQNNASALHYYNQAIALDKDNAVLYFNKGLCLVKLNRQNEALSAFNIAISFNPDLLPARKSRVKGCLRQDKFGECLDDLVFIVDKEPENAKFIYSLVYVLDYCNRHAEAFQYLATAKMIKPPRRLLHLIGCGNVCMKSRKYDEAHEFFDKAYHLDKNNQEVNFGIGEIALFRQDYARAIAFFNHAIKNNKEDIKVCISRGKAYLHQKNYDEALKDFSAALSWNSSEAQAHTGIGYVYYEKSDYTKSFEAFSTALNFDQNNEDALIGRAFVYIAWNYPDKALADFQTVLKINPDNAQAKENIELLKVLYNHRE